MQAVLANPRGFCAGVVRAIEIVERALVLYGAPIYVLHQNLKPLHSGCRRRCCSARNQRKQQREIESNHCVKPA